MPTFGKKTAPKIATYFPGLGEDISKEELQKLEKEAQAKANAMKSIGQNSAAAPAPTGPPSFSSKKP